MPTLWLNNDFLDDADASVPVRDTGFLHAAGVFTTMKAVGSRVYRLDQHLVWLRASCEALHIPFPYDDGVLTDVVGELLERNNLADARMRFTVTRGTPSVSGEQLNMTPTVLLTASELQPYPVEYYDRGMTAALVDDQKLNPFDVQAGHKTLNYLSRLSALRLANRKSAGEALWFDVHNFLQSGSISNVFVVKAGVITTPPTNADLADESVRSNTPYPKSCVLPGITRQAVIDLARDDDRTVVTGPIDVKTLLSSDEIFLTNSIMGVMPVCRIERQAIGDDKPGPVTKTLMKKLADEVGQDRTM